MKHFYLFLQKWQVLGLAMLLTGPSVWAQAPAWQTAVALNGAASTVTATATDANGDVYVAGSFMGTAGFGTVTLTSAGGVDVFVAKWSRARAAFVWAQRAGGTGAESASGVAVSSAGVYVAGDFTGTMTFGGRSISSLGLNDGFVAKITDGGTAASWEWAAPLGGAESDQAYALAVSGANVYVAGVFNSPTLQLGAFALANRSTNGSAADGFVAKLSDGGPAGTVAWVQQVGGSGSDFVTALAATASTVYVTGQFSNTVAFGNTTLVGGSAGAFVAKLADAGPSSQFAWAIQPSGLVIANAVAVAGSNVYVAGRFVFRVAFGNTSFTSTGNLNGYDAFVTKIADAGGTGSFAWTAVAGGPFSDYAAGVATSGANVYVTGGFSNTCAFGSTSLTSVGNADNMFVTKLTDAGSTGSFAWAMSVGGAGPQLAKSIAVDAGRRVYVGGDAAMPIAFGSIALTGASGAQAGFLASFADTPLTSTGPALAAARLAVFPNPAHGRATVQLPPGTGPATLTLLDALGRPLRTQTATNATTGLDLTGLAPGLYAVRVAAGGATAIQRLVME